jgi:SAM-dependent methyltransferase
MIEQALESIPAASAHNIAHLCSEEYLRQRIAPERCDYYYLHLSDLLLAIQAHGSTEPISVLDFGAGGSPYRSLFPNAQYKTADLMGSFADFIVNQEGCTNAPDKTFDMVLSTQVLEHCRNPNRHLDEVWRVLKPNGKLILSTHGLFEEHASPHDFFRWTADGLRVLLVSSGFAVETIVRITAGPRAAFHLMQSALSPALLDQKALVLRLFWRPLFRILLARRFWNAVLDRTFGEYRVLRSGQLPLGNTYIGLLALARAGERGNAQSPGQNLPEIP